MTKTLKDVKDTWSILALWGTRKGCSEMWMFPSLQMFKASLNGALSNLVHGGRASLDLWGSLQPLNILWFWKHVVKIYSSKTKQMRKKMPQCHIHNSIDRPCPIRRINLNLHLPFTTVNTKLQTYNKLKYLDFQEKTNMLLKLFFKVWIVLNIF